MQEAGGAAKWQRVTDGTENAGPTPRARAQSRGASTTDPASSQRLSAAADLAEHALGDGRGTLMMRVAQLEAALGALIEAETLLAVGAVEKSHVACCSVM